LDHEVVHWGDGAFDVGFALAHLISKAHHLPAHRHAFIVCAELFWKSYREAFGSASQELEARAARHALGCLLARVEGCSPLEYLRAQECARQREVVVDLMHQPPASIPDTIKTFTKGL
jgi:hypothetical protein